MTYQQALEQMKADLAAAGATTTVYPSWLSLAIYVGIGILIGIGFLMWLMPVYGVWASRKRGESELAESQFEQQIQIAEAQNRLKAAEFNKQAELIDAEAVAKSVEIIGTSLQNNENYMRWQWIRMMEQRDSGDTIYVPTEAGLPILEAGKRST